MKLYTVAVPLLLIATACAPESADKDASQIPAATEPSSDLAAMAATPLPEFVQKAAFTDMFEIEAGKIAQQRSTSAAIKAFAKQMVTDHTATSTQLKGILAAEAGAPAIPTALDQDHLDRLSRLRSASAADFDGVYLDQQTEAHENALNLLRNYAAGGDNAQVKTFAAETAPKVEQHLATVRNLDQSGADDGKSKT